MSASVQIRRMGSGDLESVSGIVRSCYALLARKENFSSEQLDGLLGQSSPAHMARWMETWACFVAEVEQVVVGVVAVEGAWVEELWVSPRVHRMGVGTRLFRTAEAWIRENCQDTLKVRTTGYGCGFYESMGAKVVGQKACSIGPLQGRMLTRLEKGCG